LLKNVFGGCFDDGRFIVICAVYYLWCLYTVCNGALKKVGLRAPHSLSPVFFMNAVRVRLRAERAMILVAAWCTTRFRLFCHLFDEQRFTLNLTLGLLV